MLLIPLVAGRLIAGVQPVDPCLNLSRRINGHDSSLIPSFRGRNKKFAQPLRGPGLGFRFLE